MVRLVDEALRSNAYFGLTDGSGDQNVTVVTLPPNRNISFVGILRRIAEATEDDQGPGAVPGVIQAAIPRLIGLSSSSVLSP